MLKNPVSISNFHNLITCPFKTQHRFRSRITKHVFTLLSCFSARQTSPKTEETWDVLLIQPTYPPNAPITSSIFSDIFLIRFLLNLHCDIIFSLIFFQFQQWHLAKRPSCRRQSARRSSSARARQPRGDCSALHTTILALTSDRQTLRELTLSSAARWR